MFSGIVEEVATVTEVNHAGGGLILRLSSTRDPSEIKPGDSICVDGVCLTLADCAKDILSFDVSPESVRRSTLASLRRGTSVNLERALVLGQRIGGHLVTGHVDTTSCLLSARSEGSALKLTFELPTDIRPFVAPKGSIALAGVSLTLGEVSLSTFDVFIVPFTAKCTTLSRLKAGDRVNIEVDLLARYVHSVLSGVGVGDWRAFLQQHGYLSAEAKDEAI